MLCYAMLCYAMLCYAMLCYAMLCYAMLCYAMLCYAMLCYVSSPFIMIDICFIFTKPLSKTLPEQSTLLTSNPPQKSWLSS